MVVDVLVTMTSEIHHITNATEKNKSDENTHNDSDIVIKSSKIKHAFVSKKRHKTFENEVLKITQEQEMVKKIMDAFNSIFNYNPNIVYSDKNVARRIKENREKLCKERGVSLYELTGKKKAYYKKKQEKMQQQTN